MIRLTFTGLLILVSHMFAGELALYDSGWTEVLRATGQPVYPLTVDGSGSIYYSTGTSPFDQIRRLNVDGSVDLVATTVGVVGTVADLEFGFGGDLFANQGFPGGVRRYNISDGSSSLFWSSALGSPDAGLAFDSSRNKLFVSAVGQIVALDSSGVASVAAIARQNAGPDLGLALEPTGTLLSIGGDGIIARTDPDTGSYTQLVDLRSQIQNWQQFKSIDVNRESGEVIFSVNLISSPTLRQLWKMNPDGTGLSLVAEGIQANGIDGPLNVGWGRSGDGTGSWSIFLGLNEAQKIIELRPAASVLASTIDLRLDDFGPSGVLGYRFNGSETIYGSAGQFRFETKHPGGTDAQGVAPHAVGFCIELTQNFSSDFQTYNVGDITLAQDPVGISGRITPERAALIEQLWVLHYDSDWQGSGPYSFADITRSMAFSALLCEIIYDFDGVSLASMDLRSGLFELVGGYLLDKNDPTQELPVFDVASYFLTTLSLNYSGPKAHLLALTNSTHQDYLVAVVPEADSRMLLSYAFYLVLCIGIARQYRTTPGK
jgi:hypothetical protein